jgi:hypothetical protein
VEEQEHCDQHAHEHCQSFTKQQGEHVKERSLTWNISNHNYTHICVYRVFHTVHHRPNDHVHRRGGVNDK